MKHLSSLIIILSVQLCFSGKNMAQDAEYINGQILDEKGRTLEFATISYKNSDVGTYSDSLGYFSLEKMEYDSVIVSYVGFKSKVIPLNKFSSENKINLKSDVSYLKEYVVYGNCNNYKNKHTFSNGEPDLHSILPMYKGLQYAMYFNIQSAPCKLKKVSFYVIKTCSSNKKMRLRFYTVDPISKKPQDEFFFEDVIVNNLKRKSWNHINLKKYCIIIPNNEFFVVFESLSSDSDCYQKHGIRRSGAYNIELASTIESPISFKKRYDFEWRSKSERIGNKEDAIKKQTDYFLKKKKELNKSKEHKDVIKQLSCHYDNLITKIINRITNETNLCPSVKIEVQTKKK